MGGPIELNGVVVYAYMVVDDAGTRVSVLAERGFDRGTTKEVE